MPLNAAHAAVAVNANPLIVSLLYDQTHGAGEVAQDWAKVLQGKTSIVQMTNSSPIVRVANWAKRFDRFEGRGMSLCMEIPFTIDHCMDCIVLDNMHPSWPPEKQAESTRYKINARR